MTRLPIEYVSIISYDTYSDKKNIVGFVLTVVLYCMKKHKLE